MSEAPSRTQQASTSSGGSEPRAAASVGATQAASAFTFPVRVYWEDTDAGGIVFYVNYLKFFERARTEWLRAKGVGQRALKDEVGGMFVVSETQVRYLRPARLDDHLLVTVRVERFGAASLLLAQQVLAGATPGGAVLCEGQIRIGWVDAATLRPARIPPSLLEHIAT